MCAVSMISDDWLRRAPNLPGWDPFNNALKPQVTRDEFEALKKEIVELRELLSQAKKQDEEEGNPDCEMEDKIEILKRLGKAVGIDLEEIFTKKNN